VSLYLLWGDMRANVGVSIASFFTLMTVTGGMGVSILAWDFESDAMGGLVVCRCQVPSHPTRYPPGISSASYLLHNLARRKKLKNQLRQGCDFIKKVREMK
jgi:hypothetical protein